MGYLDKMIMKTTLKDTQISLRFNGEVLEAMKNAAVSENISLSDFITKMFQDRDKQDKLETRLEALERAVFQQSQAA
jgi:predicted DNA binding CopG/RHH family protein